MQAKYSQAWIAVALLIGGCSTMKAQMQSSGTLGQQDVTYLDTAYDLAQMDDATGKIAAAKAQDPRVVDVSSQLMAQADAMTPNLQVAIQADGHWPPSPLPAKDAAELDKLKSLSGPAFDKEYIADEVALHRQAIDVFSKEDASTQNGALRTQVETEIPAVQADLAKLQALTAPPNPHPFG